MSDVVSTESVMGGQPRIDGRRISVLQIAEWVLREDMDPETVSSEFDLADVHRALAYYYDNVDEMTEWRDRRRERIETSEDEQPSPDSFTETA